MDNSGFVQNLQNDPCRSTPSLVNLSCKDQYTVSFVLSEHGGGGRSWPGRRALQVEVISQELNGSTQKDGMSVTLSSKFAKEIRQQYVGTVRQDKTKQRKVFSRTHKQDPKFPWEKVVCQTGLQLSVTCQLQGLACAAVTKKLNRHNHNLKTSKPFTCVPSQPWFFKPVVNFTALIQTLNYPVTSVLWEKILAAHGKGSPKNSHPRRDPGLSHSQGWLQGALSVRSLPSCTQRLSLYRQTAFQTLMAGGQAEAPCAMKLEDNITVKKT